MQGLYAWVTGDNLTYADYAFPLDRRHLYYILSLLIKARGENAGKS